VIGVIAGLASFWACTWPRFNDDDSLGVFGVYGVGGMTGMLLATLCATALIGGARASSKEIHNSCRCGFPRIEATLGWSQLGHFRSAQTDWRLWTRPRFAAAGARRPRYFAAWRGFAADFPYLNTFLCPPPGQKIMSGACLA